MIRRKEAMNVTIRDQMRGGEGSVQMTEILNKEELMGHGRLFSLVTLAPGSSVGTHTHIGEAEIFYMLDYPLNGLDDGEPVTLYPGDVMVTGHGHSHFIRNDGTETAHILACILTGDREY